MPEFKQRIAINLAGALAQARGRLVLLENILAFDAPPCSRTLRTNG
jgi:hypothetical protein